MKTLFLKNGMPVATAVLGMAGAFATTSMQNSSSVFIAKPGYVIYAGQCSVVTLCSDIPSELICRLSYPAGPPAFERNPVTGICADVLYKYEE